MHNDCKNEWSGNKVNGNGGDWLIGQEPYIYKAGSAHWSQGKWNDIQSTHTNSHIQAHRASKLLNQYNNDSECQI